MASKRPQTMAKIAREREVRERRARKLEKKRTAAAERRAAAAGATTLNGGTDAPSPSTFDAPTAVES